MSRDQQTSQRTSHTSLVLPYDGTWPDLAQPARILGPGAAVLGRLTMAAGSTLGPGSVIRADGHYVRIGADFHLGEGSTVHIAHDLYPTLVGNRVSVGRNAVVHACTVGDDCVIEDDAVVLDGSVVEDGVVLEAGATVYPRSTLTAGHLYAGSPARPVRELSAQERAERHRRMRAADAEPSRPDGAEAWRGRPGADVFVARTARLAGAIALGAQASVFFGCRLDAGTASITIGERTNIQDNTRIAASADGVVIGRDTTLGHNVRVRDGRIGDGVLIGMGAELGAGTVVEDEVLLAAGSVTQAGQRLEGGSLWGGRPARPLAKLDDAKRAMMRATIEQYCGYAASYRRAQEHPSHAPGEGPAT